MKQQTKKLIQKTIFFLAVAVGANSFAAVSGESCLDLSVKLQERRATLEELMGYQVQVNRSNHYVVDSLADQKEKATQTKELIKIFEREESALAKAVADCDPN